MNLFPAQGEVLVCTGCNHASNVMIIQTAVACCPDNNYMPCQHKKKIFRTISVEANCETTAEFCSVCNEKLTNNKTDCRWKK